jgi:4-hydroxy-4-methyl-2-oxoglutarate aldolase
MTISDDILAGLRDVAVASVSDAVSQLGVGGTMQAAISPIFRSKIAGPARTVLEEEDDQAGAPEHALATIDDADPGSVVVIGHGGSPDVALWGGLMAAGAHARGLEGAVLDGGVRDVEEIERDFGFPVFARSVSPVTTVGRYRTVASDVPVNCGGVEVSPGDIIVGDADGVVVVPPTHAAEVLDRAREIEEREQRTTEMIAEMRSITRAVEAYERI